MRFFVTPFVAQMQGLQLEEFFKARLSEEIISKKGFRTFAKAHARLDSTGQLHVTMLQDQGSYQSRSFAQSNCWLIIPEDKNHIKAGELIEIAPMIPGQLIF